AGDRLVLPVEKVDIQRGVGPSGNELDFGLLVTTPYQAFAEHLREGWIGFCPVAAPVDLRFSFPVALLPHAVVAAQRQSEVLSSEGSFRLQPIATPGPIADDSRGGALLLPPKTPVHIPIRLEVGSDMISSGAWSRPGLQLAELITAQRVATGRLAVWRVGETALVVKTPRQLVLVMPEYAEDSLLIPDDLPAADLILCESAPPRATLLRWLQRTSARFVGPAAVRQTLLTEGLDGERAVSLSPGARVDLPGFSTLATPAQAQQGREHLGYLVQADHLMFYHLGQTEFLGEFGAIGEQFHPQLLFMPLDGAMSVADCVHAAKILQPRIVVPLGSESSEHEFVQRCRDLHMPFAAQALARAEGRLFDGWHLQPLG
ncbi:MAG TPA: hypothetical protein VGL77_20730, partial [Armatimonadota bacterium]